WWVPVPPAPVASAPEPPWWVTPSAPTPPAPTPPPAVVAADPLPPGAARWRGPGWGYLCAAALLLLGTGVGLLSLRSRGDPPAETGLAQAGDARPAAPAQRPPAAPANAPVALPKDPERLKVPQPLPDSPSPGRAEAGGDLSPSV